MKGAFGSVSVHLGANTRFRCHTYPDRPEVGPIVGIDLPDLSLTLSNAARGAVEAGDVENARRLLEVVSQFTAEVERLHALTCGTGHSGGPGASGEERAA